MPKSTLSVAKIVATATTQAWSQAYHAGGLTAVVSVRHKTEKSDETVASLHIVGKDLLNTFESEYFTLESKNLASIKKAVETTYKKSKDTHDISLIVAASVQNALYLFLGGTGEINLFRKGKLGTVLEQHVQEDAKEVIAASGFLEHGDMVVLATTPFTEIVSHASLLSSLADNTAEGAAEIISPKIHEVQEGGAAGLIFAYKEDETMKDVLPVHPAIQTKDEDTEEDKEETPSEEASFEQNSLQEQDTEEEPQPEEKPHGEDRPRQAFVRVEEEAEAPAPEPAHSQELPVVRREKTKTGGLSHRQKIFLTIAIVLLIVLVSSIYLSMKKAQEDKAAALFQSVYAPAQKKYDEGQGLLELNQSLARDDFKQAKDMLTAAQSKFPADSKQEQQINALLEKVNKSLGDTAQINTIDAKKVDSTTSPFLSFVAKQNGNYVTSDDTNFYVATDTGIMKYPQKGGTGKTIIKNDKDWQDVGGLGTYLGNIYLLDKKNGVIKYVAAAGSIYGKSNYFASGVNPDLTKATSLAIDGSLWILSTDGTIQKFTKGKADSFTMTGLDGHLSSPTRIVTSVDDDNIYILDNGNNRIVIFKKDGTYIAQYGANVLKSATEMTVDEKNKKAFVLIGTDIYEIDLK